MSTTPARRHQIAAVLAVTALTLASGLAAHAAYDPTAFDPFGDRDPFPCRPDLVGTDAADQLAGATTTQGNDTFGQGVLGLGGNDTLTSASDLGNCLGGGNGNDDVRGGTARDTLKGGAGDDRLDAGAADDLIEGGDGADTLVGGPGDDKLNGDAGPDVIRGGDGNDWITGGAERNDIDAGAGADKVSSANGIAETVRCGSGKDQAWADRADRLVGCERVHRIGTLYPAVSPRRGGAKTVFRASIKAPFTTESAAASAGYFYDVPVHPSGKGCGRIDLPPGQDAEPGERLVVAVRSSRRGGFCRGVYSGTIVFRSSDANDNCPTQREARLANQRLDECDLEVVLGRFTFRVR
ncbi:MAG TPA: calcium-binding protein [Thermoleophilaceae bacterium]